MIYDRKRDPENVDVMAYEDEDGELSTSWYLDEVEKISADALNPPRRGVDLRADRQVAGPCRSFVTGLQWTRIVRRKS